MVALLLDDHKRQQQQPEQKVLNREKPQPPNLGSSANDGKATFLYFSPEFGFPTCGMMGNRVSEFI